LRDNTRVKRFPITLSVLMDIFTTGQTLRAQITEGIPRDSVIMRHSYDRETGIYFLMIQNDTFESVKEGDVIPIHVITVKALPPEVDVDKLKALVEELRKPVGFGGDSKADAELRSIVDEVRSDLADDVERIYAPSIATVVAVPVKTTRPKVVPIKPEAAEPSSEDLDAVAAEEAAKSATETEQGVPA
jgi:hypothetical protein